MENKKIIAIYEKAMREIAAYLWHADSKNYDVMKAEKIARRILKKLT